MTNMTNMTNITNIIIQVSNDIDFNLRRVKKHEQEQNLYKIQEQNMLNDRLKNLDELNNYTKQSKLDKLEEQKRYREILDSQVLKYKIKVINLYY